MFGASGRLVEVKGPFSFAVNQKANKNDAGVLKEETFFRNTVNLQTPKTANPKTPLAAQSP